MTVTDAVAVTLGFDEVAVIVTEPADTPVTTPDASTVATLGALVDHVIVLSVAFTGDTVADNAVVEPTATVVVPEIADILVTG